MSRRYYRNRRNNSGMSLKDLETILYIVFLPAILVAYLIKFLISICKKKNNEHKYIDEDTVYNNPELSYQDSNNESDITYTSKSSIMTECEKEYFDVIRNIVGESYIVQPQINLASVINKAQGSKYQNELFRNIDFGIFDCYYNLKLLIEINDSTHERSDRIERDRKVHHICQEAGIPIITFWTKFGVNESYIEKRIREYITD